MMKNIKEEKELKGNQKIIKRNKVNEQRDPKECKWENMKFDQCEEQNIKKKKKLITKCREEKQK